MPVGQLGAADGIFWGQSARRALPPIAEPAAKEVAKEVLPDIVSDMPEPVPDVPRRIIAAVVPEPPPLAPAVAKPEAPAPVLSIPEAPRPSLPSIVERLKSQGTAIVEQRGDKITTLQISSTAFFGSGSAALSPAGKSILGDVAVTLKSGEFAAYHITIEGHTDDAPISTSVFQSNWELSTARAAAVVRFLLELGIPAAKLTAAGYADTFPIAPNRNGDGTVNPENQARNRRVVIKLEKIDKAER
jgi:chemotaxis protein MotB